MAGRFNLTAPTDFQIFHYNKSREAVQPNGIKTKVIHLSTRIGISKKVNNIENYHYEEIFIYFLLKKESGCFSCFFEQITGIL